MMKVSNPLNISAKQVVNGVAGAAGGFVSGGWAGAAVGGAAGLVKKPKKGQKMTVGKVAGSALQGAAIGGVVGSFTGTGAVGSLFSSKSSSRGGTAAPNPNEQAGAFQGSNVSFIDKASKWVTGIGGVVGGLFGAKTASASTNADVQNADYVTPDGQRVQQPGEGSNALLWIGLGLIVFLFLRK